MPVPKQPCQARQRKFGVIDKIAPQESDDEDDRKPFPSGPNNARTSTVDDPKNASGDQGKSTFKILLTATLFSVFLNGITDCDETFNYWEPLFYLIKGGGFQTWEYSPEYGLRSWFYILSHGIWSFFLPTSIIPPPMFFFFLRLILGLVCACCQLWLCESIQVVFGGNVANIWLWLTCLSAGNFISSTAFLPSSTCMYLTCLWMGFWLRSKYNLAVYVVAFSALFSWPFSVALAIPLAIDCLIKKKKITVFIYYCIESFVIINLVIVAFDWWFYGTPKLAWLNILTYNVFSSKGPDLYGTEPISYYLKNLTINFGPVWILGLFSMPIMVLSEWTISKFVKHYQPVYSLGLWFLSPLYCWIIVFFFQAHKEERFLFPMYPCLMLATAVAIGSIQKVYAAVLYKKLKIPFIAIGYAALISTGIFGFSRLCALVAGYSASADTYRSLYSQIRNGYNWVGPATVCVGKAWHQFPTHFFLHQNMTAEFIQSEFAAQLPAKFDSWPKGLTDIPDHFNDLNKEQPERYFANPTNAHKNCHYLIDTDYGTESELEPLYHLTTEHWETLTELDILNPSKSHWFYRAFYVPYLWENNVQFGKYRLLKNKVLSHEGERKDDQ